jgi:hypothetical protein
MNNNEFKTVLERLEQQGEIQCNIQPAAKIICEQ